MYPNSNDSQPYAETAEKAIISVILQNPAHYLKEALAEGVSLSHFHGYPCREMWSYLSKTREQGRDVELVSIIEDLKHSGKLDNIGGPAGVTEMYTFAPNSAHWSQHLEILRDRLARRTALNAAAKIAEKSTGEETPEELATLAKEAAEAILNTSRPTDSTKTAKQACREFLEEFEGLVNSDGSVPGIPTNMQPIDDLTGGMRDGELWVFCGPTSGGKSVLELQCAAAALSMGKKVGVFSLEMTAGETIGRIVSHSHRIDYGFLRNPMNPSKQDLKRVQRALGDLAGSPMLINDEAGTTIEKMESLATQWRDGEGLDLLVVDYTQLIKTSRQGLARHEELAWITMELKNLAKTLKVPVVTAAQINDEGKLAEARAIGHNADVVMRIESEGLYVIKNRNGQKHIHLPLHLNGATQTFTTQQVANYER